MEKVLPDPKIEYLAGFFDGEGCVSTAHSFFERGPRDGETFVRW